MIFLSNRKLRLIIITLLLLIFCFFIGLFKSKAEVLSTGLYGNNITNINNNYTVWSNGCGPLTDNPSIGACPIDSVTFWGNNPNNWGRFYITNGANLSNKTISFVLMKYTGGLETDLTGVYLTDNNISYSCEIYNTISSQNGIFYNVICPNLPQMTGNGTSISYGIRLNTGIPIGTTQAIFVNMGLSAINGWENGTTSINDIKNTTTNINNSINDSSVDSSGASSSASDWTSKNASNGTITQLLTLPITLLQAIVNGISTSCSSFSLGSLFGTNITLPCINLSNLIGSGLFTTIDILFSGFMILAICKKLIKIFNDFTNLKSNQIDELYGGGK